MLWPRMLDSTQLNVIDLAVLRGMLVAFRQPVPELTILQASGPLGLDTDEGAELATLLASMPAGQLDRIEWTDRVIAYCWIARCGVAGFEEAGIKSILGIA